MRTTEISQIDKDLGTTVLPSFSIVIEWENARLAEMHNTREMLRELFRQLKQEYHLFSAHPEVIFVYEPEKISFDLIEKVVEEECSTKDQLARISFLEGSGLRYYEMKNLGAEHTSGDIVVFLDSDVVPEDGWLRQMLRPYLEPEVTVVAGNTYVPPNSTVERAYALFWMFPLRSEDKPLEPAVRGYANNLSCRRDVFCANRFPDSQAFRWHTGILIQSLIAKGYGVFHQPTARVQHPPPDSMHHIVSRAFCEGHDIYLNRYRGEDNFGVVRPAIWYLVTHMMNFHRAVRHDGRSLGLKPASIPKAYAVTIMFKTLVIVGYFITHFRPEIIRRYFAV